MAKLKGKILNKKLHVISLGCSKNLVDSEVMMGRLREYSLTDDASNADVIIVNTCGFISSAKEESISTILDVHTQRKKDSILVMSGCLSQRYKDDLKKELREVDIFTGVGDYDKIDELIAKKESRFTPYTYIIKDEDRIVTGSSYHAYVKISEGCNQSCSFCAIPTFKGKLNSRSLDDIEKEVKTLVKKGYFDFTFISQDSSSFLKDINIKDGLIKLIERIEDIRGVKSARILYLYPTSISNDLIDKIASSDIFHNYFDMPIQHIDDGMLKLMKRGAGEHKTKELLQRMRKLPNSFVRTSFIAGHPGESQEAYSKLISFAKEFDFDRINVFEYSHEENTKAYNMKPLNSEVKNSRMIELSNIASTNLIDRLKMLVDKSVDVVVDGISDEHEYLLSAKSLNWAPDIDGEIYINENEVERTKFGKIYKAKITQLVGDKLVAKIVS